MAKGRKKRTGDGDFSSGSLVRSDPFKSYLLEAGRYPLLTEEEERRLTEEYRRTQDPGVARKLVLSNLRLVIKIAMDYYYKVFCNLSDLIQEGNIGLMLAVKKYNPSKGIRFPSYAQFWIRAYMLKYLLNTYSMVKVGTTRKQKKVFYNIGKAREALEQMGVKIEPHLLAEYMNVSDRDVKIVESRMQNRDVSLDAPLEAGGTATVQDMIVQQPDFVNRVESNDMRRRVSERLKEFAERLSDKERYIWEHRLLSEEQVTLQEIAEKLGVSKERVRQLEERILEKLKKYWTLNVPDISITDILSTS
jgi:RNA polymerase sigma-32 factor